MKSVFLITIMVHSICMMGQAPQTYTIKPGMNVLEVIPKTSIYLYPDFISGRVIFKDQRNVSARLNYNALLNAIQFINPAGDTLSLAEEHTIKLVSIAADTFYYRSDCLKQLSNSPSVKLAEKEYYREFVQKPGSYGLSSGSTSADNINVIVADRGYKLNTEQEVVLAKTKEYFIGNSNGEYLSASKKNLSKLFPKHSREINEYLNKNNVDFTKKENLVEFIDHIKAFYSN